MDAEAHIEEFEAGERARSLAKRIGCLITLTCVGALFIKSDLDPNEIAVIKMATVLGGIGTIFPTVRSWQEKRQLQEFLDEDDGDDDGDWPPGEDPHPIVPNNPGGLYVD